MKLQEYCSVLNKSFAQLSRKEKHGGVRVKLESFKTIYTHPDVQRGLTENKDSGEVFHNDTHEEPYEAFVSDEPEDGDYVDEDGDEGSNNNPNDNRDSNNEVPPHEKYYRFDADYMDNGSTQPHYCAYPGCTTRFTKKYLHTRHYHRVHNKNADDDAMAMDTAVDTGVTGTTTTAAEKRKKRKPEANGAPPKKSKATANTAAAATTINANTDAAATTNAAATTATTGDPRPFCLDLFVWTFYILTVSLNLRHLRRPKLNSDKNMMILLILLKITNQSRLKIC